MLKTIQIYLISLTFALFLTACGPSESDAQKLGFSSVPQMKELTKRGYANYQEYVDAASRGAELCFKVSKTKKPLDADAYDTFCKDKKVIWVVQSKGGKNAQTRDITFYQNTSMSDSDWDSNVKENINIINFKDIIHFLIFF